MAKAKNNSKNYLLYTLMVISILFGVTGICLGILAYNKPSTPITFLGSSGVDGNSANFVEGSIAEIADGVSKSVVSIITSATVSDFWGRSYNSSAAGTGVIVTEDGYILTNKHVINDAAKASVVLDDGTTYEDVKVVAADPTNDVAFLKIDGVSGLNAAILGDSKTITVGQQVIAIGNALGEYQNTVTSGIVSGVGRSVTVSDESGYNVETLFDMIQTDAAINSGNSGGPLVNAAGEVIGINTATSTSAQNMGFAIPISSVKGMLKQLIKNNSAKKAFLGVYSVDITPEIAKAYELPINSGAYLYSRTAYSAIAKGSPAAKAGLVDKDIITEINGVNIGSTCSLSCVIGEYEPGDTVQLTVYRNGGEFTTNVTFGEYEE